MLVSLRRPAGSAGGQGLPPTGAAVGLKWGAGGVPYLTFLVKGPTAAYTGTGVQLEDSHGCYRWLGRPFYLVR
jgi:hypothetical protein